MITKTRECLEVRGRKIVIFLAGRPLSRDAREFFNKRRTSLWLSSPWFIVISGGGKLILRASKLSADGFSNPPIAGIEGFAPGRSVVVGRTRPLLFLCHADAPSSGSIG
jgi:hypothetical protein